MSSDAAPPDGQHGPKAAGMGQKAGMGQLWAMGVGAVISGDFFGWQWGLVTGGTGGMLVATVLVCAMYVGLCFSLAELSAAIPSPLGTTAWACRAFGDWGGLIVGVSTTLECATPSPSPLAGTVLSPPSSGTIWILTPYRPR